MHAGQPLDPSALPPDLQPRELGTDEFVTGRPHGDRTLGLVLKRTYAVAPDGTCELAEEQEPISDEELPYDDGEPPAQSSVQFGNDTLAFKDRTDVIVQGSAYAYDAGTRNTQVLLRAGNLTREITVYGDRVGTWSHTGRPQFSEPQPFTSIPLRFERAFGGVDRTALERHGWPEGEALMAVRPGWDLTQGTPYHYPRNPSGLGYLIELSRTSFVGMPIPNLEFPFDPVTPERVAVGSRSRWHQGPLPAAMDWQGGTWFPRIGYLGLAPPTDSDDGECREIELGWEAPDLGQVPSVISAAPGPARQEYTQAAASGMSVGNDELGDVVEVTNMHPDYPVRSIRLPAAKPVVRLEVGPRKMEKLRAHLSTVVIRPDKDEVVMTWCASIPVDRHMSWSVAEAMRRDVLWTRGR